jgi:hypothetical protein
MNPCFIRSNFFSGEVYRLTIITLNGFNLLKWVIISIRVLIVSKLFFNLSGIDFLIFVLALYEQR